MKINTKFEIGQEVWAMIGTDTYAKPQEVVIGAIEIKVNGQTSRITYSFYKDPNNYVSFSESSLFATKKALLESLEK